MASFPLGRVILTSRSSPPRKARQLHRQQQANCELPIDSCLQPPCLLVAPFPVCPPLSKIRAGPIPVCGDPGLIRAIAEHGAEFPHQAWQAITREQAARSRGPLLQARRASLRMRSALRLDALAQPTVNVTSRPPRRTRTAAAGPTPGAACADSAGSDSELEPGTDDPATAPPASDCIRLVPASDILFEAAGLGPGPYGGATLHAHSGAGRRVPVGGPLPAEGATRPPPPPTRRPPTKCSFLQVPSCGKRRWARAPT